MIDAIRLLKELIKIPSVTPLESADFEHNRHALDILQSELEQHGAECHRSTYSGGHEKWDYKVDNLFANWSIGTPKFHLCFLGHIDVVPVGSETKWSVPPFSGEIHDGWIYGRGATDMKGAIAAWAAAIAQQLPKLTDCQISMVITGDEEWAAINGSDKVFAWMAKNQLDPDFVVVGEPSSPEQLATHIKVGRRGSLCGTVTAHGIQGHAAYPDLFDNPNTALALGLTLLQQIQFNDGTQHFPDTQFEVIALESGNFNASAIIPAQAKALWNIRFTHHQNPADLLNKLNTQLSNSSSWVLEHPGFPGLKAIHIHANIDTASHPYFSKPNVLAQCAIQATEQTLNITPSLNGVGGTTDGRFIHNHFPDAEIIELGLPENGGLCPHSEDFGKKGGMHQIDECCRVDDVRQLAQIYANLINQLTENVSADALSLAEETD